jgi:hypothetical protein
MNRHCLRSFRAGKNCFPPLHVVSLTTLHPISLSLFLFGFKVLIISFFSDYFSGDCLMCLIRNFSWWHRSSQVTSLEFKEYVTLYGLSQTAQLHLNRSFLLPTATWRIHYCGYDVADVLTQKDVPPPSTRQNDELCVQANCGSAHSHWA